MGFIQVIEVKSSDYAALEALHERWLADSHGQRTTISERICRDRDQPDRYLMIVEFESYEDAMRNNELAATGAIAERITALSEVPPTFRNLDLLRND